MNLIKFIGDAWEREGEENLFIFFIESNENPLVSGSERVFISRTVFFALFLFALMFVIRETKITALSVVILLLTFFILVLAGIYCIKGINKVVRSC